MRRILGWLAVPIAIFYPLAVGFGDGRIEPRFLAAALLVAGLARFPDFSMMRLGRWWFAGVVLLGALAIGMNAVLPLRFYPVMVNGALLTVFAFSLWSPPTVIERLARLREPELPAAAVRYTRRVTQVWCGFFAFNGALSLVTALWASARLWMLYNGCIAYILMGFLFAGEFVVRSRFKRRNHA